MHYEMHRVGRELSFVVTVVGFACATLAITLATGCSDGGSAKADAAEPMDGFDRRAMLSHLATNVLLPMQIEAAAKIALVPPAIGAYCDALDANASDSAPATSALDAARSAFVDAIDAWETTEAVLVGPAAMDNKTLRGLIYSWPLVSPCELDRDTASRWADPSSYDVEAELVNARSLSAVEFLLYPPSNDHNCGQAPVGWTALATDLPKARCRLALAIATDASAKAQQLATAWRPDGGNYVGELANAGTASSSIGSAHGAVNLVSDGLIVYVDQMVKSMKLAETTGIGINACQVVEEPCVREVELRYADRSTQAIRANLVAARAVFTGTTATSDGPSFDDFLIALGHQDVADRMTNDLEEAIAAANALPESFLGALSTSYAQVVDAHTATKDFTDDLKSQFLTLLALEIPDDVATDND